MKGMCYLTAIKVPFFRAVKCCKIKAADFSHPKITEVCYLPQAGTQCDVISRRNHALLVPCNEMPCLMAGGAVPHVGSFLIIRRLHSVQARNARLLPRGYPRMVGKRPVRNILLNRGLLHTTPATIQCCLFSLLFTSTHCLFLKFHVFRAKPHLCYSSPNESSIWNGKY